MLTNPNPGGWAAFDQITHAQMNSFGQQIVFALDGNAGGTYNPTALLILGGTHGLQLQDTANLLLRGSSGIDVLNGDVIIHDGLFQTAGPVEMTSTVRCFSTLQVDGALHAEDSLEVDGVALFHVTVTVDGLVTIASTGKLQVQDGGFAPKIELTDAGGELDVPLIITDEIILANGSLIAGGSPGSGGRIRWRVLQTDDADQALNVTMADVFVMNNTHSGHSYEIDNTGATIGSEMELRNYSGSAQTILNESSGSLVTLPAGVAVGFYVKPSVLKLAYYDDAGLGPRWAIASLLTAT